MQIVCFFLINCMQIVFFPNKLYADCVFVLINCMQMFFSLINCICVFVLTFYFMRLDLVLKQDAKTYKVMKNAVYYVLLLLLLLLFLNLFLTFYGFIMFVFCWRFFLFNLLCVWIYYVCVLLACFLLTFCVFGFIMFVFCWRSF